MSARPSATSCSKVERKSLMRSELSSAASDASGQAARTFFLGVVNIKEEDGERHRERRVNSRGREEEVVVVVVASRGE